LFNSGAQLGVEIEVMYSLISLLLLTGMVHIETLLKERLRMERAEQRLRAELESEVKKKTAYLTRAIEELQSEIDGRKRVEAEVEKTHKELLAASRQAGMVEIAAGVLHNVGNMLKSVDVSASLVSDQVKQSKIANVVRVGTLIREHVKDLGDFMARDPRGQKLPEYIAQLAEHLASEQTTLSSELESLRKNIEEVEAEQQSYTKLIGKDDTVKKVTAPVDFQRTQTAHPRNHCGIRTGANYQCISGRRELGCSVEAVPRKIKPSESSDRRLIRCWMPARATAELGACSRSIGVRCSPSAEHRPGAQLRQHGSSS
jgi:phage host-nuclease inhibitor protein Gam